MTAIAMDVNPLDKVKNFFGIGKFSKMFYVVIIFELFERGAYYGMMAMLQFHTVINLGFKTTQYGIIMAALMPCLFFLPLISGAIAEKYGFKKMFTVAFSLLALGYFLSFFMGTFVMLFLSLIVMGIGAGLFKPIVSASIGLTSGEENRNHAYALFYWTVNLGATIVPLAIAMTIPTEMYGFVFILSAVLITVDMFLLTFFFRNPIEPKPEKSILDVLKNLKVVVQDKRFFTILMIFSGFWFMYSILYAVYILYAVDFGVTALNPAYLAVVNPGVILLMGPVLGSRLDKYDSLKLVITGMLVSVIGILIIGFFVIESMYFTGLIVFTIGEFIAYPTFIAYTSRLAPENKLAIYMAFIFLPSFIGSFLGNLGGTAMYTVLAEEMHMPPLFWVIVASCGMVTVAFFLLFNRRITKQDLGEEEVEAYKDAPLFKKIFSFTSPLAIIIPILIIPVLVLASFGLGTSPFLREDEDVGEVDWSGFIKETGFTSFNGECAEQSNTRKTITLSEENIVNVTFLLRWTDEPDQENGVGPIKFTYENGPDKLSFTATLPDGNRSIGRESSNPHGGEGRTSSRYSYSPDEIPYDNGTGAYEINVRCGDCGDFDAGRLPMTIEDTGNAWTVEVTYEYYVKEE